MATPKYGLFREYKPYQPRYPKMAPEEMVCHVANGNAVIKMSDTAIFGKGWIRSFHVEVETPEIMVTSAILGDMRPYERCVNTNPVITLEIEMDGQSNICPESRLEDFSTILAESLSNFELMKILNKRWKQEDENKQN